MMTTTSTLYARTGAAAIAAALALSSTPLIAQEAPASTQPVPILTPPPPTTSNSTPAATTTDTVTTPDTSTTDTTVASTARTRRTVTRARATAAAPPAQAVHRSITRQTAHVAATGAPAAAAAKAATPVAAPPASPPTVQASPTPRPAQRATTSVPSNETALEFGAGVLALIVLGGLAWGLSRRRRRDEFVEDRYGPAYEPAAEAQAVEPLNEPTIEHEQPAIVAPSAFAWGNEQDAANGSDDGSDRRAGESWVERAYRGPSPANPSASLRNRLKRAAFFDQREREVAAGEAKAVDTDAGLPEATEEREFA
jgi:resuscitation-promoting factor RpfA